MADSRRKRSAECPPSRGAPWTQEPARQLAKILDYALTSPTHGPQRVSSEPRLGGTEISPSGARGVWLLHGIETRYKRLMRLEQSGRSAQALMEALKVTEPQPTAA